MNFAAALHSIKTSAIELNFFETLESRSHPYHHRTAIIATRFYLVLIIIAVFIALLFTALTDQTQTITIRNPSESVFQELQSKYSTTLRCPCSQLEIPYKTFINISYRFHPVCSSVFVSDNWINLLFRPDIGYFYPWDFRSSASGEFQLLSSLCSFVNRTIKDAVNDFLSDTFLSPEVLSVASFQSQNKAKSQFLQTSTNYNLRRLLNLVRGTTKMNGLQPAMQTSKMHLIHIYPNHSMDVYPYETIWVDLNQEECFCGITSDCYSLSGFYDLLDEETQGYFEPPVDPDATVTGFFVGCYALDALLYSSLECFFDQTCLATVLTYFPLNNITYLDVLDINQTQYPSNTTIEVLVNNLFIEDWPSPTSFFAYYSQCSPILCTYKKVTEHKSILQILITLLGVYGGLTVVLHSCVPRLVRLWRNRKTLFETEANTHITYLRRFRNMQESMKNWLIKLNLFDTPVLRTDPDKRRTAVITTRVYLVVLSLTLTIITTYLLSAHRVYILTIEKPSQATFESLYDQYPATLQCPCSHIVNSYGLFTSLSPTFHPVCSSVYISDPWIVSISNLNLPDAVFDEIDFRVAGPTFFNTLAALCSLSKLTINDTWYVFQQTPLITDLTLIQSDFQTRTAVAIERFQNTTTNEFQRILSLDELHTKTMYTTGYENALLYTDELAGTTAPIDFGWAPVDGDTCSCGLIDHCEDVMSFFTYTDADQTIYSPYYLNFTLPDIPVGCLVVSSVLQSSLDCFFNQTCLDAIRREIEFRRSINVSILDAHTTRFLPTDLIGSILDDLMIERWNDKVYYEEYYKQCAPEQCTYTYTSSNSPAQIITTLFGLFGGLTVALKVIVPIFVRAIRKWTRAHREARNTEDHSSTRLRAKAIWHQLKTKMVELNLFNSELTWDDDQRRRTETITTRIYLLLLILAIIILVVYTFIDTQTETVKVLSPSEQQFDQLRFHPQYSPTLDCPCQNILVPYHSFISITPHYHQLCSSDFVTTNSSWISLLYSSQAGVQYSYDDYRLFAVPHFQLLTSLCSLANDTITEAIAQFSTNVITNERVQSHETIEAQTNTSLDQFRLSTPQTSVRTLDFIRSMAQGNGIVSTALSNWHFLSLITDFDNAALWAEPHSYNVDSCSCGTNASCTSVASFNGFIVPGFYVGCYSLESLLQSTLECLYSISCIDQLKSMYNYSNMIFNPLDSTLSSPNVTVQSLVNTLFVQRWNTTVTYEQYYTACSPLWCTYTFDRQISPIYTVTIIIGLYGGLSVALKLIAPVLVKIGSHILLHRRPRVTVVVNF